jgi:hypothetical protein
VADAFEATDPETWPDETLILRGGVGDAGDLARKLDVAEGGWSAQADPLVHSTDLAKYIPNNRFRRTTLGELRAAGGYLAITPGPGYHRSVRGLTPEAFDSILDEPELNPVLPDERWPNR